jgi:hypothetical protein
MPLVAAQQSSGYSYKLFCVSSESSMSWCTCDCWQQFADYKEKAVEYRPGTVLLYGMDTLHRGTPVKPGAERLTHHFGFKRASAECKTLGWQFQACDSQLT